jgi:autotransporter-associated beta strand protein/T5SS/PEP-CTERM-associated repeat protein
MFLPLLPTGWAANAGARSLRLASLLVLAGVFVGGRFQSAEAACASDDCWTGGATSPPSADWFVGANWSTTTVPTSATNVIIDQGSPTPNPSIGINNSTNAATSFTAVIGDITGAIGSVTVSTTNANPASWTLGGPGGFVGNLIVGPLMVGGSGTGSLTISNGGAVSTTGNIGNVVIGSVGTGTVTVGSATAPNLAQLSTLTNNPVNPFQTGALIVGDTGHGTLIINPDGAVSGFPVVTLGHGVGGQGTATVNGGSLVASSEVDVGLSGPGTLIIENGGTVTTNSAGIAELTGSAGSSATVTGTNSIWTVTGGFSVGSGDTGSLSIQAGGEVNAAGAVQISIGAGPTSPATGIGTATVDNGKLIANGAVIYVGVAGNPGSTMTVRNGGQVVSDGGSIGGVSPVNGFFNPTNATGVVTVTGAGSLWDDARDGADALDATSKIFIDNPVSMTGLVIQQGGQVITGSAFVSDFGNNGTVNSVVVDGVGSKWTNLTSLNVGYFSPDPVNAPFGPGASTGAVNISNGGQVSAPSTNIGMLPDGGGGAIDRISVSGTGSSLQASGMLAVGLFGTGDLTVSAGATVASGNGIIGYSSAAPGDLTQSGLGLLDTSGLGANSVGTVTITGAGSTWTTDSLIVGDNTSTDTSGTFTGIGGGTASGTLTVANGGAVSSTSAIQVALNAGATGTINIGAADGQAAAAPGTISAPAIVFGAGTGTIVFNHTSTNYVFAVPIQGPGSVIVDSGTTIFTANNTYTGPTTINGGTLEVDGTIANSSGVTVNAGGTLSGTGTVDPPTTTTIMSQGTLAPGNAANPTGTLTITGNLAFQSGALYLVTIGGPKAASTNISGTAALGGHVQVAFASGPTVNSYDILRSAGLGGTTFTGVSAPNFNASLSYTATDVFLNLTAALGAGTPLTQNEQNAANAIEAFFNGGGTLPAGFANLFTLSGANLANALNQLDGEDATGAQRGAFDLMNEYLGLMLDPFAYGAGGGGGGALGFAPDREASLPPDIALAYAGLLKAPPKTFAPHWTAWASGFGGTANSKGDPTIGSNNVTTGTYGTAAGLDYHYSPDTVLGFSLAGGGTNWNLAQGLGKGRSDAFLAGAYGVTHAGPAYLAGALAFANNWFTTNRTAALADQLSASFQGQSYAVRIEGGYRFAAPMSNGAAGVTPYGAIQAQNFHTPGYSEVDLTGGGFGLSYNALNATDTRSELGGRFDALTAWGAMPVQLRARVAWAHDWVGNPALSAAFQALPGASFVVNGAPVPHDSALTSVGAEMHLTSQWTLLGKFDGEFASRAQTYAGTGTLRYAW